MCVIMVASTTRPTEEMVERAWKTNPDGFGIAHRDRGDVVFHKGIMDVEAAKDLCANIPLPYVCHFRIASIGGVRPELTHPFPISKEVPLVLEGRGKDWVLFHNGHWGDWNGKVLDAAIHSNNVLPEGKPWSDSRGMAFLVKLYGTNVMEMLPTQKGVIVTPQKFLIYTGTGWEQINDVWCSNDYFWLGKKHGSHNYNNNNYGRMCRLARCTNRTHGGKEICDECEKKQELQAKQIAGESNVGQSQSVTALAVVTGGSDRGPLAKMLSLAEVEGLHKAGLISKSLLKEYRKATGAKNQQKPSKAQRAVKRCQELSEKIAERLMTRAASEVGSAT